MVVVAVCVSGSDDVATELCVVPISPTAAFAKVT
jgi:hypothetical protein